jgi:hypothetical protein
MTPSTLVLECREICRPTAPALAKFVREPHESWMASALQSADGRRRAARNLRPTMAGSRSWGRVGKVRRSGIVATTLVILFAFAVLVFGLLPVQITYHGGCLCVCGNLD